MNGFDCALFIILFPFILAFIIVLIPGRLGGVKSLLAFIASGLNLFMASRLFLQIRGGEEAVCQIRPWAGMGIDLSFSIDSFAALFILAGALMAFLIIFYTIAYLRRGQNSGPLYFYLLSALALTNGALMANNLFMLLFFWMGLLIAVYGLLISDAKNKPEIAAKSLTIGGFGDILLMLGLAISASLGGTLTINALMDIPPEGIGALAFIFLIFGAAAKTGAPPFALWLPEAGEKGSLPFTAVIPGAFSLLLGVYLLSKTLFNFYLIEAYSSYAHFLLLLGIITALLPLILAFRHKNIKRIILYIGISQGGFMLLGLGTILPVGITGGVFHLLSSIIFLNCLYLSSGALQRQGGAVDLDSFAGLGKYLPISSFCFFLGAASAIGLPLFSGFSSRALIMEALWEYGNFYYILALLAILLTAILLIKIVYRLIFLKPQRDCRRMREAPGAMLLSMLILAALSLFLGIFSSPVLGGLIKPALSGLIGEAEILSQGYVFILISLIIVLIAASGYFLGLKKGPLFKKILGRVLDNPAVKRACERLKNSALKALKALKAFFAQADTKIKAVAQKACIQIKNRLIKNISLKAAAVFSPLKKFKFNKYIPYAFMPAGIIICLIAVIFYNL